MKRAFLCLLLVTVAPHAARATGLLIPKDTSLPPLAIESHRVNVTIPARQFVPIFGGSGGWVRTLDDGTRLMRVAIASEPESNLEPHIESEVLFEIPNTNTRISIGHLRLIYKVVNEDVIPRFSRFLPESMGIVERQYGTRKR